MDDLIFKVVLDADPRPSLVLDLQKVPYDQVLDPCFINQSFRKMADYAHLLLRIDSESSSLRRWICRDDDEPGTQKGPRGTQWLSYDISKRWRVVQEITQSLCEEKSEISTRKSNSLDKIGMTMSPSLPDTPMSMYDIEIATHLFSLSAEAIGEFEGLSQHLAVITGFDWASTSMGAIDKWPSDLLQVAHLILLDPAPQCLFLGDNVIMFYNVAYANFAGERHPSLMGTSIFQGWKEAVELNIQTLSFIDSTGRPFVMEDFETSLIRNGYLEELSLKWTTIPLRGPVRAYLCTTHDITSQKTAARRKALLSRISQGCRGIRDMSSFWNTLLTTLSSNEKDFPYAFIYSKELGQENVLKLEGVSGSTTPTELLPEAIDLHNSDACFVSAFKDCKDSSVSIPISEDEKSLPSAMMDLSQTRGSKDRCTKGLVCAIRRAGDNETLGLLTIGLNTRKRHSPDDKAFITYMTRSISDVATNAINAQESDRLARQTASQHQTLIHALSTTTLEAEHLSDKFKRLAKTMEMVDVGLFEFETESGKLVQANEAFFKLSNWPRDTNDPFAWTNITHPDDLEGALVHWDAVSAGATANFDMRYKFAPDHDPLLDDGLDGQWVSLAVVPGIDPQSGKVVTISGCATNIMPQKRRQLDATRYAKLQQEKMQEAVEAKRLQEYSLDFSSHEIRNPMAAVVHCADEVLSSLSELERILERNSFSDEERKQLSEIHSASLEAVNTIISCSTHQRRIVDDVLTWSKLNSSLLKISPSLVHRSAILPDIRNMFEINARKVGVALDIVEDRDVNHSGRIDAELLMFDLGRTTQILINLITNAIKFTSDQEKGNVTITMGITHTKPGHSQLPIEMIPTKRVSSHPQLAEDWGTGDDIYLYFTVQDTGCGLTSEEKSKLFARFSQASPRTHTKYGGSGLGLYISRELVELQNGEIGISSVAGVGSTFGFFVKAKLADPTKAKAGNLSLSTIRPSSSDNNESNYYNILIVEDNIINQTVLSKQLRRLGHHVLVANHGQEALEIIRSSNHWNASSKDDHKKESLLHISVILMDVEMPIMDGLTCTLEIRKCQNGGLINGHIPIIAVSANARIEQVGQALACGMDDSISKPFRIVDLLPKIERLVGISRQSYDMTVVI